MTHPRKKQKPFWSRRNFPTRRRHDFDDIMDAALMRLSETSPGACQMISEYRNWSRLPHIEERILLHRFQVQGDRQALEDLIRSFLAVPVRAVAKAGCNDEFFEDLVQEMLADMIEYLSRIELSDAGKWTSLVSLVPLNARKAYLYREMPPVRLPRIREFKIAGPKLALQGREQLEDMQDCDMEMLCPDSDPETLKQLQAGLLPAELTACDDTGVDPTPVNDRKIDLMKVVDWARQNLDQREWTIFSRRYLQVSEDGLDDIGRVLGITAERVRQIDRDIVARLGAAYRHDLSPPPEEPSKRGRKPAPKLTAAA